METYLKENKNISHIYLGYVAVGNNLIQSSTYLSLLFMKFDK